MHWIMGQQPILRVVCPYLVSWVRGVYSPCHKRQHQPSLGEYPSSPTYQATAAEAKSIANCVGMARGHSVALLPGHSSVLRD